MSLLPCQLQAEQLDVLCNTVPGSYPCRPIMPGRMAMDALILPIQEPVPEITTYDTKQYTLGWKVGQSASRSVAFPFERPGAVLWLREQMRIISVVARGRAVQVRYLLDDQWRTIYLDDADPEYREGQQLLTPRIEWSRPDRLTVREVYYARLQHVTEQWAARLGAAAVVPMQGRAVGPASHLTGLRMWWGNWYGLTDWEKNPLRMVWLATFERGFAED